jgi:hypothetical protein
MGKRRLPSFWIPVSLLLLFPATARGYIDPGTGSYVLQLLIAGLLGALFALKVFWRKVVDFLKAPFGRRKSS